jgi:hypothetical protein
LANDLQAELQSIWQRQTIEEREISSNPAFGVVPYVAQLQIKDPGSRQPCCGSSTQNETNLPRSGFPSPS